LSAQPYDLLGKLAGLIATDGDLQGRDGVLTEDLRAGFFGTGSVVLRARQAGLPGAVTRVTLSSSGNLVVSPATEVALDDNLADAAPRNHLYVSAGVTNLNLNFSLNTTKLSDGFHELTAVAYEGTHVRTQTRASLPIVVKNSSLDTTLASTDLAATNSVTGAYHLQVTANSANVTAIHLFSTGGELGFTTNQSTSTFSINGADLGVGLHPFYAVVETSTGQKFRTPPLWARFIPGN
jgi:hypothetical protein